MLALSSPGQFFPILGRSGCYRGLSSASSTPSPGLRTEVGFREEPEAPPRPPAEPISPCPQMKVAVSRGGDHNSDGDSFREASSSRRSSSRDQLSDVSAPAAHRNISESLGGLPGLSLQQTLQTLCLGPGVSLEGFGLTIPIPLH